MIEISGLNKTYDRKSRHANHVLRDISLTLPDTGFVCIVGASGCGKTSLLNAVGGLDAFDSGKISTERLTVSRSGTRVYEQERNNSFSYIFQNYYLLSDHSAAYNVYLGMHSLALSHRERLARVKEALEAVNMSRYSQRIVGELSGGQQQRVAIARALARRPRVIFADEPTGNLDEENTLNICTILRKISRDSLVVMVTHEEQIARFFADRIITLGEGRIVGDERSWQREDLAAGTGSTLYAGDYASQHLSVPEAKIRILTEEGAAPAELTIAVLKDKIIIKSGDGRALSCSKTGEAPVLSEGKAPVITLEEMDDARGEAGQDAPARAGTGLTMPMMLQEAGRLLRGRMGRRKSIWFFLAVMTVFTMWIAGDYITVSSIDPRDFVTTDSHLLELSVERGENLDPYIQQGTTRGAVALMPEFIGRMRESGVEFDVIPYVSSAQASIYFETFPQMSEISVKLQKFSFVPIGRLEESSLVYGRMPENSEEVVVDRWVLENIIKEDGVRQNGIGSIEQLLGRKIDFFKKKYAPVIVGICDCGDPAVYLPASGFASVGNMGTEVMGFTEFQQRYPGLYEGGTLGEDECIVVTNNVGVGYANKVGSAFKTNSNQLYTIAAAVKADTYAGIVVADPCLEKLLIAMNNLDYCFYTPDKQALKSLITELMEGDYNGLLLYRLKDVHGDAMRAYRQAASLKADARIIVTVTVILLSMAMLYLIQRSYVQQRIGMMAVYRLLGLPRRKLLGIFAMESLMLSARSVLPAAVVTWVGVAVLNLLTDLGFSMILPWQAAAAVCLGILVYYLLVSLLPVGRLLRMPPARLAAKYDI